MAACKIEVGKRVMVHTKVMYKQYELPEGAVGTIVNVDEFGDCRVSWTAIGTKWLLQQDFQRINIQDAEGNWTVCASPTNARDDDDLGCVEDERASPVKAEKVSGRTLGLLNSLPDPVLNLEDAFNDSGVHLSERSEAVLLNLVVPEEAPREGQLPLGLVLDNASGAIVVAEVRVDSWGARSGVVAGDVIVALGGVALQHASREEVERLGRLRPLPMQVLRRPRGLVSPAWRAIVSDLMGKLRSYELRANAAEQRLRAAEETQLSRQDPAQVLEAHRARAEERERAARDAERRADALVARLEGRPAPQSSDVVAPKSVLIGLEGPDSSPREAPQSSAPELADEISLPVADLADESLPEPCWTRSSPSRLPVRCSF